MDLLATVKKEGSRGGRGDFKWSDVSASSHREHYLGHSVMAPTGRWARGKDLNWYAKGDAGGDNEAEEKKAADERAAEIKSIKEAEADALARALGLPVPDRSNPNTEALGTRADIEKAVKEGTNGGDSEDKGIGYAGSSIPPSGNASHEVERLEGTAENQDRELHQALKEYRRRHGEPRKERRRSRSRSPGYDEERERRHRRHRSRERQHRHRRRSRSRDDKDRKLHHSIEKDDPRDRRRERSYSADGRHNDNHRRDRGHDRRH